MTEQSVFKTKREKHSGLIPSNSFRLLMAGVVASTCFFCLQCSSGDWGQKRQDDEPISSIQHESHDTKDASLSDGVWQQDTHTEQGRGVQTIRYSPPEGSSITYQLQWSWVGARWDESARAYVFQNNLGYTFGIQVGYVGLGAMQLVHCDMAEGSSTWGQLGVPWLPIRWQIRTAHADHGFSNDSSFVSQFVAENMAESKLAMYAQGKASGQTYCRLHVLYVPVSQQASDGFELKRRSLWLQGWYQKPRSPEKNPWQVELHLQSGGVIDLRQSFEPTTTPTSSQEVRVVRYPARSLDGIAPDSMHSLDAAHQFLLQLAQTTEAVIGSPVP